MKATACCALLALVIGGVLAAPAQDSSGDRYQESYGLEAKGEYEAALKALEKLPSKSRDTYMFRLRKGWLLYLARQYTESVRSYEEAVRTAPKAIEPRLGLMLPQVALRRWADLEKTARAAMRVDPQNYTVNSKLAYALYNLGKFKEAQAFYRKVSDLYPSDVEMLSGLGWCQLKLGKNRDAAKTFRYILSIAPNHAMAREGMRYAED
ncbi:MAG: tetratricopeptide repeat protein [Planctomycetota bacterium]|jgi:tetratricopeptide (TPR) repeat protein